jgi:AmmeMemoRadiSam system protein B
MCAALALRFGLPIDRDLLEQLLAALDQALLLENDRFAEACDHALVAYRQAPFRPPALAGPSYPDDPAALRRVLQDYLDAVDGVETAMSDGRGVISPHIDYGRGGPVYAAVWKRAAEMARQADLVVLLGTDHYGGEGQLTLTRQHYATPFGVLPTAQPVVNALAEAIGPDAAFAGELRHRSEHSIELSAVWLHYVRAEQPCEIVPILCGSFGHFIRGAADPGQDPTLACVLDTLAQATAGRRVLVVASGDLAHVGPAFGGPPLDRRRRARLRAADEELIDRMCACDAEGFFTAIQRVGDRNNVCGLSPIYLALRMLGAAQGEPVAYDRCPADDYGTSVVSVCGVVLG